MRLIEAIVALLEDLEKIEVSHEEVTDTDVRESLRLTLNHFFVWGQPRSVLPRCYGMFTRAGDGLVTDAVHRFLDAAANADDIAMVAPGQARLDLLQSVRAATRSGARYDLFLGHQSAPFAVGDLPEHLFMNGEYETGDESGDDE